MSVPVFKKIGLLAATDSEISLVRETAGLVRAAQTGTFPVFFLGEFLGREIVLAKSGIGKVNSALACLELIKKYSPDCIINTGAAGAVAEDLSLGTPVAGSLSVYHDVWCGIPNSYGQVQGLPARFASDRRLLGATLSCGIRCGLICSGDMFITEKKEIAAVRDRFPEALAVDMESCSIAQTCFLYKVPFLPVRFISDTADSGLRQEEYDNFWKEISLYSFSFIRDLLGKI